MGKKFFIIIAMAFLIGETMLQATIVIHKIHLATGTFGTQSRVGGNFSSVPKIELPINESDKVVDIEVPYWEKSRGDRGFKGIELVPQSQNLYILEGIEEIDGTGTIKILTQTYPSTMIFTQKVPSFTDRKKYSYILLYNPVAQRESNKWQLIQEETQITNNVSQTSASVTPSVAPKIYPPANPQVAPSLTAQQIREVFARNEIVVSSTPTADADRFIDDVQGRVFDWQPFPTQGGLLLSADYLAYLFKFTPLASLTPLVMTKGGKTAKGHQFTAVLYDPRNINQPTTHAIIGGITLAPVGSQSAQNTENPRVVKCTKTDKSPCKITQTHKLLDTADELKGFLRTQLTEYANSLIPLVHTAGYSGYRNPEGQAALWEIVKQNSPLYLPHNGNIGEMLSYSLILQKLFASTTQFPFSETSHLVYNISAENFWKNPLFLYFAANPFSRTNFSNTNISIRPIGSNIEPRLLANAVLMTRFLVLADHHAQHNATFSQEKVAEILEIAQCLEKQSVEQELNKTDSPNVHHYVESHFKQALQLVDQLIPRITTNIQQHAPEIINLYKAVGFTVDKVF